MRATLFSLLITVLLLVSCQSVPPLPPIDSAPEFTLHQNFGSHMVLQQGRPIKISGHGTPGHVVQVTLGIFKAFGRANSDGEWDVTLPAMEAGGPYTLTVYGANDSIPIILTDIKIGEVWLFAGGSSVETTLREFNAVNPKAEDDLLEYDESLLSDIRLFNTTPERFLSPEKKQDDPRGEWVVAGKSACEDFSALAYLFAKKLQIEKRVPVGVIQVSWPDAQLRPWISESAFRKHKSIKELSAIDAIRRKIQERTDEYKAQVAAVVNWCKAFQNLSPKAVEAAQNWKQPILEKKSDRQGWSELPPDGVVIPGEEPGIAWLRYHIELPISWSNQQLELILPGIHGVDKTYFNGKVIGSTGYTSPDYHYMSRRYKIPSNLVRGEGDCVIAIRISNYGGLSGLAGPAAKRRLVKVTNPLEKVILDGPWQYRRESHLDISAIGHCPPMPSTARASAAVPGTLFNALIAPWTHYPLRGIAWYQGEADVNESEDYARLFKMMVEDWRQAWKDEDLAFLYCQLAEYAPAAGDAPSAQAAWAKFREMQQRLQSEIPGTAMAGTQDSAGETPQSKYRHDVISDRLLTEAMRLCYGIEPAANR